MNFNHITNRFNWRKRVSAEKTLPSHLPRLVLKDNHQPNYVNQCPTAQRYIKLLRFLEWEQLPATLSHQRTGERTVPLAAYIGAYLLKLDLELRTIGALRRYLREHPSLIWALGFPLAEKRDTVHGFDADASLPTHRHLSKKLSTIPNETLQALLDGQVATLLSQFGSAFGDVVALDTKHIVAWVKENNPKAYVKGKRFDKTTQPAGDPDCKVGYKNRSNQVVTPTKEGKAASSKVGKGEYYWGYASGIVVTKMADVGEFVLAETTMTFDQPDLAYFFPLMEQTEQRLGRRPRFATMDAAYDAFYIYDYFHREGEDGFAAIPLRNMKQGKQSFDENGLPLCDAHLPMPLKSRFRNRTKMVQFWKGRYACPLLHPQPNGKTCPIDHAKWPDGGCVKQLPTSAGVRVRYQLDRESESFKAVYRQRTAAERIFSQAIYLGIERPKLRNRQAIANQNTLTYLLINLRAQQRIAETVK